MGSRQNEDYSCNVVVLSRGNQFPQLVLESPTALINTQAHIASERLRAIWEINCPRVL